MEIKYFFLFPFIINKDKDDFSASSILTDKIRHVTMSVLPSWKEKANEKRISIYNLIPQEWRLSESILNNPPKNSTIVPSQCGILSKLDLEITEIDNIEELANRIANGKYSSVQVIEAYCKRAAIAHQLVNCLAEIFFTQAFERAQYLDDYYKSTGGKTIGPLHGIPISLKDQFNIKGIETAMGYIGYLGHIAEYNSIIADTILSLGGVLYVKTALPQTIMMPVTKSHLLGITLNPLNREVSCGGSSGGEGSLIAMKGSICGLGTDIGGSIRFPSALNGIYGLKPSDGRIPYGLVKNSFDGQESIPSVIGPMTRSLLNIRLFFKSILDTKPWLVDPKVHNIPWREDLFQEGLNNKLCFGVVQFNQIAHLSPPVQRAINMSINALEKAGHQVIQWDTSDHPQVNSKIIFLIV
jgi:amidase